jgi:hypothetical protein
MNRANQRRADEKCEQANALIEAKSLLKMKRLVCNPDANPSEDRDDHGNQSG